jgi:hypothetical protein
MELDELKKQLKFKLATDHTARSEEDIATILTKKTKSIIAKLKRSLLKEMISCLIIILIFAYIGLTSRTFSFKFYFSFFSIVSIGFLIPLYYLYKQTTTLSGTAFPVKSNLQTIVTIIENFIKRYFQFTMAMLPICFIFALLLGYHEKEPNPQIDSFAKVLFSSKWQVISFIVVYLILLSVGIYYFTKWYLKKLYGNYLVQLKDCIRELSEE